VILGIDHVGIATEDVAARETFAGITGHDATEVETLLEQRVRVCFVPAGTSGSARLEILDPAGDAGSPVARFLQRRGEGLHHVCLAVDDIHAELRRLAAAGFQPIDAEPRRGHGGWVAFLHPKSAHGVLIELLQRDEGAPVPPGRNTGGRHTESVQD
jgi:methylmalonyl-CoA/ethylmalonyl-CoA epimerase